MTYFRYCTAVMLVLLLASCGRQLPEATPAPPRPTSAPAAESTAQADTTQSDQSAAVVDDSGDEIVRLVANADPANGQNLFNTVNSSGFACAGCHNANSEARLIGPGLYNVPVRAATRVEGEVAQRYIYNSILHPNDYIVEGDPAYQTGLMPQNYSDVFSDDQVYDIIAYLMTLQDAPQVAQAATEAPSSGDTSGNTTETTTGEQTPEVIVVVVTATPSPTVEVVATEAPPAVEATAEPTVVVEYSAEDTRTERLLSVGNAEFGENLYGQPLANDASCADCHATDNADQGADGAGLLGAAQAIADANPDVPPNVAVYNAILSDTAHGDIYTTYVDENSFLELANIVAYLMTLEGDGTTSSTDATESADSGSDSSSGLTADQQAIVDAVMSADAAHGQELFNTVNSSGFACSVCHNANSQDRLIGPGLLGIPTRAETRVEGDPAIIYIWHSITAPNDYIVEGEPPYPAGVMPQNYSELFTDAEIYDIIAYLLTLNE